MYHLIVSLYMNQILLRVTCRTCLSPCVCLCARWTAGHWGCCSMPLCTAACHLMGPVTPHSLSRSAKVATTDPTPPLVNLYLCPSLYLHFYSPECPVWLLVCYCAYQCLDNDTVLVAINNCRLCPSRRLRSYRLVVDSACG